MGDLNSKHLIFQRCSIDEIMSLRYAVLCAGRPIAEARFDGDNATDTHHFGAFLFHEMDDAPANVGCVSYMLNTWNDQPAWQLRGMATRPDMSGQGIGTKLTTFAEQTLSEYSSVRQLWCNARVPAIGFYERLDWKIASEEFVVPNYGPHQKMLATMKD